MNMTQLAKRIVACIGWSPFFLVIVCSQTWADGNNVDLESDIRSVIEIQLRALAVNDASTAYAQASPEIRKMFPTEDIFMMMVRSGYGALISPRNVTFLELIMDQGAPIYKVGIESPDGKRWMALYRMDQQPKGNWLIAGCVLLYVTGQSV